MPINDAWIDFVCIFERVNETTNEIIINEQVSTSVGLLKQKLIDEDIKISEKIN